MPIKSGAPLSSIRSADGAVSLEDFYALPWSGKFMFLPTRMPWPADSINVILPLIPWTGKKPLRPADWLAKFRRVEQMTWVPGEPEVIEGRLLFESGWEHHLGKRCLNTYRPPTIALGDASLAGPWIKHVEFVYPDDSEHIQDWFAYKTQNPGRKINHGLLLGGFFGIGKDTILAPVREAVGTWNVKDITPDMLTETFTPFTPTVILRVNEARDLGDSERFSRYALYEKLKIYAAAPPEALRHHEKYMPATYVLNVLGLIVTTNHQLDGFYLPAGDRRYYVAWSPRNEGDLSPEYFTGLWRWIYEEGGAGHVAAYLRLRDVSKFDPKAPPPKTEAFRDIVHAGHAPEDTDLDDVLDGLKRPAVCSLNTIVTHEAAARMEWLLDRKLRRTIPHRMERCGYVPVRNPNSKQGLWTISERRVTIYGRTDLKPGRSVERRPKLSSWAYQKTAGNS